MTADATPRAGEMAAPSEYMIQVGLDAMRTDNVRDSSEQGRVKRIWCAMEEVRRDEAAALARALPPAAGLPVGALQKARNALVALRPILSAASDTFPGLDGRRTAYREAMTALDAALAPDAGAGAAGDPSDAADPVQVDDQAMHHNQFATDSAAPAGGGLPGVEAIAEALWATERSPIRENWSEMLAFTGHAGEVAAETIAPYRARAAAIRARLSAAQPGELTELDAGPYGHSYPIIDFDADRDAFLAELRRDVEGGKLSGPCVVDPAALLAWADGAVAAMEPGAPSRIPARVADDLAYSAEIDAAIAEGHGGAPPAAPAREPAADGLRAGLEEALRLIGDGQVLPMRDGTTEVFDWGDDAIRNLLRKRLAALAAPSPDRGGAADEWHPDTSTMHALAAKIERLRLTAAARDVLAERRRQVEAEGWFEAHDDEHSEGQIGRAALNYLAAACLTTALDAKSFDADPPLDGMGYAIAWPWEAKFWKPGPARRMLVKALALGLAEIERLDRATPTGARP